MDFNVRKKLEAGDTGAFVEDSMGQRCGDTSHLVIRTVTSLTGDKRGLNRVGRAKEGSACSWSST